MGRGEWVLEGKVVGRGREGDAEGWRWRGRGRSPGLIFAGVLYHVTYPMMHVMYLPPPWTDRRL